MTVSRVRFIRKINLTHFSAFTSIRATALQPEGGLGENHAEKSNIQSG